MVEPHRHFVRHGDGEVIEVGTEALAAKVRPFVEKMDPSQVYVITAQGQKVKRTTTGRYVSHDEEAVVLLDARGRFNRVPIERIIRINYYIEGREPF